MLVDNKSQGLAVFKRLFSKEWVTVDTETVPKDCSKPEDALIYGRMKIKVFSMCHRGESYSFPTNVVAPEFPSMSEWASMLVPYFEQKSCIKVAHNWNYDFNVFYTAGIRRITPIWDTMIGCWLSQEYKEKGLKSRSPLYGRCLRQTSSVNFNNLEELAEYAEQDVVATDEIYQTQVYGKFTRHKIIVHINNKCQKIKTINAFPCSEVKVEKEALSDFEKVFLKIHEFPILRTIFRSTRYGLYFDLAQLKKTRKLMIADKADIVKRVYRFFGKVINLNSTKQLIEEFNAKGIVSPVLTKKGKQSFGAEALITLKASGVDPSSIVSDILNYKAVSKLESVYIGDGIKNLGLEKYVNKFTSTIHPSLNSVGAVTGRSSCSNPNCYTKDTELLTPEGWIEISKLKSEKVAQFDPRTNEITFTNHSPVRKYRQNTVHISNQHISLSVSTNHRCLLENRRTGARFETTAIEFKDDFRHLHSGVMRPSYSKFDSTVLALAIMIQADGSYYDSFVEFCFKRERKIDRAAMLLSSIPHRRSTKSNGVERFAVNYDDIPKGVWRYVDRSTKHFKWNLLFEVCLNTFCSELRHWDGSITGKEYCSRYKINADIVQAAYSLIGKRAMVRPSYTDGKCYWRVRITDTQSSMTTNFCIGKTGFKDVFGITVPTSWLLIRHDGRTSISGNCQQIPSRKDIYQIKRTFKSRPSYKKKKRVLIVLDQSQLEIRVMAIRCGDSNLVRVLSDPKGDIHTETAQAFLVDRSPTAKQLNFLLLYGGGAYMLGNKLTLEGVATSMSQAAEYVSKYDQKYGGVRAWREAMLGVLRAQGYCHYLTGRTRTLVADEVTGKPINWSSPRDVHKAETTISNNLIQGDGQDFIKAAIIRLNYRLPNYDKYVFDKFSDLPRLHKLRLKDYYCKIDKVRKLLKQSNTEFLLQVHDELKYETDEDSAEEVGNYIAEIMTWRHDIPRSVKSYAVPLAVEVGIANTWYDAKGKNPMIPLHYFGTPD